jgi:pyruvate-formate lyase-activating enzyme
VKKGRFCSVPFSSMELFNDGTMVPCCKFDPETEPDLNKYTIKTMSLQELFDGPVMTKIRRQFTSGEEPTGCRVCWKEEAAGIPSMRQERLSDGKQLLYLDFKFTNLCNLKCRICNPWCSSTWAKEHADLGGKPITYFKQFNERKFLGSEKNVQDLHQWLETVKQVGFFGGEPLMQPEHREVLSIIAAHPRASEITLYYNTNCTQYDPKVLNLWHFFKEVNLHFSIDDVSTRFEYQRHPAKWAEALSTIDKFHQNVSNNVKMVCYTTVSLYNLLHLDDILAWNRARHNMPVIFNMLHQPSVMSATHAPEWMKEQQIRRLSGWSKLIDDPTTLQSIRWVTEHLRSLPSNPEAVRQFLALTAKHDAYRGESLESVDPELYKYLTDDATNTP